MTTPISHVSDTARWVAICRAMESERPDEEVAELAGALHTRSKFRR